jgi:enamine deaminase RidA (YjgF/YER057c/UK114 family)
LLTNTILSGAVWEESYGYARARVVGDQIFIAGTGPVTPAGTPVPEGAVAQIERCFEIAAAALEQAGSGLADVVQTRFYLTRAQDFDAVGHAHGRLFGSIKPVTTGVVVAALRDPTWLVEIEAHAVKGAGAAR